MRLLIFLCIFVAALCSICRAQSFLARRDYYTLALGFYNVAVFDANSDGIPDLIYNEGNFIGVQLGEGNGTFLPPIDTNFSGNYTITPIAYADLNHDGKIDLIAAARRITPGSSGLGVMLGQGDGTFGPLTFYSAGLNSPSERVLLADVNGDGRLDAVLIGNWVSGNAVPSGIVVWLGNGDGTFNPNPITTIVGTNFSVGIEGGAVADFNRDGNLDVAFGIEDVSADGVAVWLGDGTGHFQPGVSVHLAGGANDVATADLNHDGFPDLVAVNNYRAQAAILLGKGDGTFQTPAQTSLGACTYVTIGDVNGDGVPDLVGGSSSSVTVALGNGDGTFQPRTAWFAAAPVSSPPVLASLRNNGRLDIVSEGSYGNLSVLLNNGAGKFLEGIPYSAPAAACVAAADFNRDGHPDVLVQNTTGGVQVYWGTGRELLPLKAGPASLLPSNSGCAVVADFNKDGIPDLVVAGGTALQPNISVYLGKGDGTFPSAFTIGVPSSNGVLVVGDVNGDGNPDVITSTGYVLLGNGDGTLQNPLAAGSVPALGLFYVTAGDLNRDGKTDLIFAGDTVPGGIYVLISNGDGTFRQTFYQTQMYSGASESALADFNGDGIPDIAVPAPYGGLYMFLGNGDGTFRAGPTTNDHSVGYGLIAADFNGDGKIDLASPTSQDSILMLLGNGDGTFQDNGLVGAVSPFYALAIAKLHGQAPGSGRPDIVTAGGNAMLVLVNTTQ